MNDFNKEEREVLASLAKPILTFATIKIKLDAEAKKLGYEDHEDFICKTGWKNRFVINEDI